MIYAADVRTQSVHAGASATWSGCGETSLSISMYMYNGNSSWGTLALGAVEVVVRRLLAETLPVL